ncbi:unnamed protein product [Sphacelaria rigidula]
MALVHQGFFPGHAAGSAGVETVRSTAPAAPAPGIPAGPRWDRRTASLERNQAPLTSTAADSSGSRGSQSPRTSRSRSRASSVSSVSSEGGSVGGGGSASARGSYRSRGSSRGRFSEMKIVPYADEDGADDNGGASTRSSSSSSMATAMSTSVMSQRGKNGRRSSGTTHRKRLGDDGTSAQPPLQLHSLTKEEAERTHDRQPLREDWSSEEAAPPAPAPPALVMSKSVTEAAEDVSSAGEETPWRGDIVAAPSYRSVAPAPSYRSVVPAPSYRSVVSGAFDSLPGLLTPTHHDRELLNEASFAAVGSPGETPRNFSPINRKNGSANTSTTVANNNGGNNDRDDVHTAPSSAQSKPDAFTLSPTSSFKITTSPSGRRRRSGSDDGIGWIAKGLAEAGAATEAAIPAPASLDPLLPCSEMRGPSSLPSPTRKTCLGSVSAVTHEANSTDGHSVEWRSRRYAVAASAPATPVSVAPHASSSSVLTAASSALTRAAATNPKSSAVSPNSTPPISDSQKAVALSPHEGQSSAGSGGGGFSGGGSGFLASGGGRSVTARPPSSPAGGSSNQGGGEAPPSRASAMGSEATTNHDLKRAGAEATGVVSPSTAPSVAKFKAFVNKDAPVVDGGGGSPEKSQNHRVGGALSFDTLRSRFERGF